MSKSNVSTLLGAFLKVRPRLEALVRARVSNNALAEDVLQDAWLKLEAADAVVPVENTGGYLARVVNNAVTDHFRKEKRRTAIDVELSEILWDAIDPISPEQQLIDREKVANLCATLEELPAKTRYIFLQNRIHGISHSKIAAQMGMTDNAVYYHIRRALEHLAKLRGDLTD